MPLVFLLLLLIACLYCMEGDYAKRPFKSRPHDQITRIFGKLGVRKRWGVSLLSLLLNLHLLISFWASSRPPWVGLSLKMGNVSLPIHDFLQSSEERSSGGGSSLFLGTSRLGRSYSGILKLEMHWRLAGVIKYRM